MLLVSPRSRESWLDGHRYFFIVLAKAIEHSITPINIKTGIGPRLHKVNSRHICETPRGRDLAMQQYRGFNAIATAELTFLFPKDLTIMTLTRCPPLFKSNYQHLLEKTMQFIICYVNHQITSCRCIVFHLNSLTEASYNTFSNPFVSLTFICHTHRKSD